MINIVLNCLLHSYKCIYLFLVCFLFLMPSLLQKIFKNKKNTPLCIPCVTALIYFPAVDQKCLVFHWLTFSFDQSHPKEVHQNIIQAYWRAFCCLSISQQNSYPTCCRDSSLNVVEQHLAGRAIHVIPDTSGNKHHGVNFPMTLYVKFLLNKGQIIADFFCKQPIVFPGLKAVVKFSLGNIHHQHKHSLTAVVHVLKFVSFKCFCFIIIFKKKKTIFSKLVVESILNSKSWKQVFSM